MDIETYTQDEKLVAKRLINEEMDIIKNTLGHTEQDLSLDTITKTWNEVASEIIFDPTKKQ